MNKQELIEKFKNLLRRGYMLINMYDVLDLVKQLDEPQPVKVPQFVADWYEENKYNFDYNVWNYFREWGSQEKDDFYSWIDKSKNSVETLANMHQFGYEVEKDKLYRVSIPKTRNHKNNAQLLCYSDGKFFWCGEWTRFQTRFTRKELEEAGFGWVFDCEGIDIVEVEE